MNFIFLLALTVFIEKSCSQTLSKDLNCFENGDTLMLNCITTDLTQGINFYKDSVDQGGCVPLVGCASGITQSGVTTSLEISSFSDSTNSGSWTCTYGGSTSTAVAIAANPCVETTEGPTEGSVDNECWCKIDCDNEFVCIGIIIAFGLFLLFLVILIIVVCVCCCTKDSNEGLKSYGFGDRHCKPEFAGICINLDCRVGNEGVKETEENGQNENTGLTRLKPVPSKQTATGTN